MFDDLASTLKSALSIVAAVFAAFGGFLLGMVPVFEYLAIEPKFAVGVASFVAVAVLLIVRAVVVAKSEKAVRRLAMVGVIFLVLFVVAAGYYARVYDQVAFRYPPDGGQRVVLVGGTKYTAEATAELERDKSLTKARLLALFGGELGDVWTEASIRENEMLALVAYLGVTTSASACVFLLLQTLQLRNNNQAH